MSKIQKELADATEVTPRGEEGIDSQGYMKRLVVAVGQLPDKAWDALSDGAQEWNNSAAKAIKAGDDIKVFPDYEAPRARTRARADDDEKPAASREAYKPRKGDTVKIVTKRGKKLEGEITDPDDKGVLVLKNETGEIEVDLDKIDEIDLIKSAGAADTPRRRRAAEDDDPTPPGGDPEAGDTITFKTSRGKVVVGVLIEDTKDDFVLREVSGEEVEYSKAKIDGKVEIKVKGKVDAGKSGGGSSSETKERATRGENGGVSVTTRLREIVVKDKTLDLDGVKKILDKEGLKYNDSTAKMVYTDSHKMFALLAEAGEIKYKPLKGSKD